MWTSMVRVVTMTPWPMTLAMTGFRDGPSVEAATAALKAMAARNGWALVVTDKAGAISPAVLRQFDAVGLCQAMGEV